MCSDKYQSDELINVTEQVVYQELENLITGKVVEFCCCELCLLEIVANTLNKLPAVYWPNRSEKYRPHTEQQKQEKQKLHQLAHLQLLAAITHINSQPLH